MLAVAVVAIAVTAGLLGAAAFVKADERVVAHAARARLRDYETVVRREEAMREPLATRVLVPLAGVLADLARRYAPTGYVDRQRHKLTLAGRPLPEHLDRFLVVRVLSLLAVPVALVLVGLFAPLRGTELVALMIFVAMALVIGPDAWLNREVAARQHAIRLRLPDVLDLLVISVEAGLGFEQALARTATMVPGPLSEEFARTLGELRAGATRADALSALDQRTEVPELRSFTMALLQADTFGVSVGQILRSQAAEMRVRRQQMAQEMAQKAPVKMLFPMVFCIMPALFVVIAGPAVLGIYHAFHH